MPFGGALTAGIGAGGSLLGGLFGKNKKQSSTTNSTQSQSGTQSGTSTPIEDPFFAAFRKTLLPAIAKQYQQAQQPIYGDAQKAQYLNDANDFANASGGALRGGAAARGQLDSGAFGGQLENLEAGRQKGALNFFSQIPFLNEQARTSQTNNLLGLATGFLGRAPVGQSTTGNFSSTGNSQSTTNGTQTNPNSLLGGLGGWMQNFAAGNPFAGFGSNPGSGGSSGGSGWGGWD